MCTQQGVLPMTQTPPGSASRSSRSVLLSITTWPSGPLSLAGFGESLSRCVLARPIQQERGRETPFSANKSAGSPQLCRFSSGGSFYQAQPRILQGEASARSLSRSTELSRLRHCLPPPCGPIAPVVSHKPFGPIVQFHEGSGILNATDNPLISPSVLSLVMSFCQ